MLEPASPENYLSINVISLEGNIVNIKAKPDSTIEMIKTDAVNHFYSHDTRKLQLRFRLVHSSKFKQLVDNHNISDEEISENDTLLLVEIRPVPVKDYTKSLKGPDEEAILQVTSNLPVCNPPRSMSYPDCYMEFQSELQKILITLVKASAKILMYSSEAQRLCEILQEKFKAKCKPTIDPNTVKTLMEMGYSHKKVLKALCLRKSNVTEATAWLREHENDPDDDDDLDLLTNERDIDKHVADPSSSTSAKKKSLKETCIELFRGESQSLKKDGNLIGIVDLLLEIFRRYKKMDFKPDSKAVQALLEMGFEETSIISALKITGNDQTNAREWLLGERRPELLDFGEELDPESPIYKAIMNSPDVRLSLTNPRMLLVYLSILETPTAIDVWINDPEVSLVLCRIIKTYYAEKHAAHLNRYLDN